jgi:hypothetical protein
MKLTEEQSMKISNALAKKHNMNEGLVGWIFGKALTSQLMKDKKLNSIVKDLDNNLQKIKDEVEQMKKRGEEIPPSYKHILNMK